MRKCWSTPPTVLWPHAHTIGTFRRAWSSGARPRILQNPRKSAWKASAKTVEKFLLTGADEKTKMATHSLWWWRWVTKSARVLSVSDCKQRFALCWYGLWRRRRRLLDAHTIRAVLAEILVVLVANHIEKLLSAFCLRKIDDGVPIASRCRRTNAITKRRNKNRVELAHPVVVGFSMLGFCQCGTLFLVASDGECCQICDTDFLLNVFFLLSRNFQIHWLFLF